MTADDFLSEKETKQLVENACYKTATSGTRYVIESMMRVAYDRAMQECGVTPKVEILVYDEAGGTRRFSSLETASAYTNVSVKRIQACIDNGNNYRGYSFDFIEN